MANEPNAKCKVCPEKTVEDNNEIHDVAVKRVVKKTADGLSLKGVHH